MEETVIERPVKVQNSRDVNKMANNTIPLVSLKALRSQCQVAEQTLGNALKDIGFFALVDHDLDHAQIAAAYDQVKQLFALPSEVKDACSRPELGGQVGFTRFLQEKAKDAHNPDLKEYWHVMRTSSQKSDELSGEIPENVWPNPNMVPDDSSFDVEDCQKVMLDLFASLDTIAQDVLGAISVYIKEPRSFLPSLVENGYSVLRLLNYPKVETEMYPGSIRAAAHEDINFITLLVNATSSGLELLQRDGIWLPVVAPEGAIIIDSADMLANLTNGLLKATTHRVVNTSDSQEARYSMPFFVHPRQEVSLNPRPGCIQRHPGAFGRDITAKDFLRERLIEIGVLQPVRV